MHSKKLYRGSMLIVMIVFFVSGCFSQERIIDKSGKSPKWKNSTEKGFIIEVGKGASINDAKDKALAGVKESIVKSVAEQITSVTEENIRQTREGNSYLIAGTYTSSIRSKTAQMPFITGVSESKVDSYYWEKLKDKKTGNVSFYYFVKYPFSDLELKGIIMDFEMQQKKEDLLLSDIDEKIETANSLDELAVNYREIKAILPQLEGSNKMQGELIMKRIQSQLKSVSFKELKSMPGSFAYILVYGNKELQVTLSPTLKSNCADNFKTTSSPESVLVNYSYNGCFDNQSNKITLNYQIDDISIKQDFPIDITSGKVEFLVVNGFQLFEESSDSIQNNSYRLSFELNSKFPTGFNLTKIILEMQGRNPIIFDNLNAVFSGKGIHDASVQGIITIKHSLNQIKQGELASGSIFFINSVTQESGVLKFYNEKLSTNF